MQVTLTKPELERFVEQEVRTGRFSSANDVIETALARLMAEASDNVFDAETVAALHRAEAQIQTGKVRDFRDAAAELRARFASKP